MSRLIDADYLMGTYQAVCSAISCEECRAKYKDGTCKLEHWLKAQPTIEERKNGRYIDAEELKNELRRLDWQDLYLPVHFDNMIDECKTIDKDVILQKKNKYYKI